MVRSRLVPALCTTVLLTSLAVAGPGGAATTIAFGPGPQSSYRVATQPPAGHCHYRSTASHQPLPDPHCNPGARNPRVTPATIHSTICVAGYTAAIRPPSAITSAEKRLDAASYHYTGSLRDAEYDHLIPLELGGDPNDPRNLWVEPPSPGHRAGSGVYNPKDSIENEARSLVCSGSVSLTAMQQAIATNWTTALAAVGH